MRKKVCSECFLEGLATKLPGSDVQGRNSIQSHKLASTNSQKDLDHRIYFLIGRCDKTDDEWHTGSLHTGESAQLGSNSHTNGVFCLSWWMGVVGNDAPLLCGCTTAVYCTTKTKCIRHCDSLTLKHMANINDSEYQSYNHLCVVWSRFFFVLF